MEHQGLAPPHVMDGKQACYTHAAIETWAIRECAYQLARFCDVADHIYLEKCAKVMAVFIVLGVWSQRPYLAAHLIRDNEQTVRTICGF